MAPLGGVGAALACLLALALSRSSSAGAGGRLEGLLRAVGLPWSIGGLQRLAGGLSFGLAPSGRMVFTGAISGLGFQPVRAPAFWAECLFIPGEKGLLGAAAFFEAALMADSLSLATCLFSLYLFAFNRRHFLLLQCLSDGCL